MPAAPELAAFLDELVETLRSDGPSRERLVRQFSASSVRTLLVAIDPELHVRIERALRQLDTFSCTRSLRERIESGLVEAAIEAVAACGRAGSAHVTAESLLRVVLVRIGPSLSVHERDRLERSAGDKAPAGEFGRASVPPQRARGDEEVAADGLLVDDAGLVLLHPFLPQLFDALGLAQGGRLLRPERALLLLRHLATGALDAEEHELVFAKVLCGLPIEEPVGREAPITTEEQGEATVLLEAVVRHWDALGNTSADGLRGNFLARPGRLELRDAEWVLRVESRSCDVLLDRLPWGLAHVKLPWMPRLLRVEWVP